MSLLALVDIQGEDFRTSTALVDRELRLMLVGTADMRVREKLQALLAELDGEARRVGARVVIVDFRELDFMDSSCFKGLVSWIDQARQHMDGNSYRIRFASNDRRAWHRRSLYALQCFAADLVTIEAL